MRSEVRLLFTALVLLNPPPVKADETDTFISASHQLITAAAPGLFDDFFTGTTARLIGGETPPLARYRPGTDPDKKGTVEFGHDLRRYKKKNIS